MRSRKNKRRIDARGATLLEVMISMSVFSVGMLGMAQTHIFAANAGGHARRIDRASSIARDLMNHMQEIPFDHPLLADVDTSNNQDVLDESLTLVGKVDIGQVATGDPFVEHASNELPDSTAGVANDPCAATGESCLFSGYADPTEVNATGRIARPSLDFNGDGLPDFRRSWTIADHPIPPGETKVPAKDIVVVVAWRDSLGGVTRRFVLYGTRFNPEVLSP